MLIRYYAITWAIDNQNDASLGLNELNIFDVMFVSFVHYPW